MNNAATQNAQEEQIKVLVVDDESEFRELVARRFQKRGLKVAEAGDGMQALQYLEKNEVDVVILDIKMPRMNGLETLQEIKKRHSLVEVILLTGHGSVESGIQGMGYGAYDYVMKPFNLDDILFRISKACERRQKLMGEKR